MPHYSTTPDTLLNTAYIALGNYVRQIMKQLIQTPSEPRGDDHRYHHYEEPCNKLQRHLARLPAYNGRLISNYLLGRLCKTYSEIMANPEFRDACEEITPFFVKSLLHPYVRTLDGVRCPAHPHLLDIYKPESCELFYKILPLFEESWDVKIGPADRTECALLELGALRESLVKFMSRSCTDSDIETLANECKNITHLDISCSTELSDNAIDHLLKFNSLRELNLLEVNSISQEALHHLLARFAEVDISGSTSKKPRPPLYRSQQLIRIGCSNPSAQTISLISQFSSLCFIYLSHVVDCVLTPLAEIKKVLMFTLSDSRFVLVKDFLIAKGNGLVCLNLIDVVDTDFNFITENCYKVKCIHLCFKEREHLILPRKWNRPGTLWVPASPPTHWANFLQINISDLHVVDFVLTRFPKLTRLFLSDEIDEFFLESLMQRFHNNRRMEQLFWGKTLEVEFKEKVVTVRRFCSGREFGYQHIYP
ncbi:uncharacterized protein LOC110839679 [Zootermopsis nevadensis]|uniref:Uncharacterized protein n=1 Tax=Zootermopsis nevadensis TaxID=136037 RepID=A0A067QI48_ZOONE|nr:uncharacterized protein LOC110839679 [Zootermopsis nevadensis]KDR08188.1 hypothetical protein L798_01905 [Zootermopsis nevadensis]